MALSLIIFPGTKPEIAAFAVEVLNNGASAVDKKVATIISNENLENKVFFFGCFAISKPLTKC